MTNSTSSAGLKIQFANLNELSDTVYVTMYGNDTQGGATCSFTIDPTTGAVTLTPLVANATVPEIKFSDIPLIDNVPTIDLGTQWIDSARIYFSIGQKLNIPVSAASTITDPGPLESTYDAATYDWIEFTLNNEAVIYINTTQVDMFGMPTQLSITPIDGSGVSRVGILNSRDEVLNAFQNYLTTIPQAAQDAFNGLLRNDASGNPQRILNPTDAITLGLAASPLYSYFDSYITDFFDKYDTSLNPGAKLELSVTGVAGTGANGGGVHTLSGTVTTISGTDVLNNTAQYRVLQLTDTTVNSDGTPVTPANGQIYNVYQPFFSTNNVNATYGSNTPIATASAATGPAGLNYFTVDATTLSQLETGLIAAGTGIALNSIITGIDSSTNTVTINTNTTQPISGTVKFYKSLNPNPPALAPVSVTATGSKGDSTLTLSSTTGIDPTAGLVIVNGSGIGINNVATAINTTTKVVTLASPNVADINGTVVFASQSTLANNLTLLPSHMVVAGSGVFADNTYQFPTNGDRSTLLGAIENIIASAFNRGIATNDASDWTYTFADQQAGQSNPFYDPNNTANSKNVWNYYGEFFHQLSMSAYGRSYAISFDDQGSFSTTLSESASASSVVVDATLLPVQTKLSFNDTSAAGTTPISGVTLRSGDILNAIQTTNGSLAMPQHGDSAGTPNSFVLAAGDSISEISGYTGEWFGRNCVVQLQFKTKNNQTYGPFGTMDHVGSKVAFSHTVPSGQSLVAFSGSLVNVPLDNGTTANVIQSLSPIFQQSTSIGDTCIEGELTMQS